MSAKLLTPIAVSEQLDVSTKVVMCLLRSGRLEGVKVGRQWRVLPIAIDRYLARHRYQPAPARFEIPRSRRLARMPNESELPLPGARTFL